MLVNKKEDVINKLIGEKIETEKNKTKLQNKFTRKKLKYKTVSRLNLIKSIYRTALKTNISNIEKML